MCLISICPKGTLKSIDLLSGFITNGMKTNIDGSGIMFKRNNDTNITISKGYYNPETLIQYITKLDLQLNDELVIHHRRGTSGLKTNTNCHPFVITNDEELINKTEITINKSCLVHNGVFRNIESYKLLNTDFSDTYAFSRYIMPDILDIMFNNNNLFSFLLKSIINNDRVCMLHPDRDLTIIGNFTNDNGYLHSNDGYKKETYDYGGSSNNTQYRIGFNAQSNIKTNINLEKFDSSFVVINKDNYNHFYYVKKMQYDNDFYELKQYPTYKMDSFSEDSVYQTLTTRKDNLNLDYCLGVTIENINEKFYFIPVDYNYQKVYNQLVKLIKNHPGYNKKTYNKLSNLINSNYKKGSFDEIVYSKINERILKLALKLYKNYLEFIKNNKTEKVVNLN
jgi:hypothetical protein